MKKSIRAIIVIGIVVAIALTIRKLNEPKLFSVDGGYRTVMGTFANIAAVSEDHSIAARSVEAAFDALVAVDDMMSDYKPDSELSRLNRNGFPGPVEVSPGLFDVLLASAEYSRMSEGAFDITIGPVVELWKQAKEMGQKPTQQGIAAARSKVGYEKLILKLDGQTRTVRFAVDGMRLDLGAIAKGYAIDRAIRAAQRAGASGAIVDIGGDVSCFGVTPRSEKYWRIGLQDPADESNFVLVLKLADAAVATSGDYQRFVEINGQRYSHIIDPATSSSAREFTSVTIIAPTAIEADALATCVSVMGLDAGMRLVESLDNVEALIIGTDHSQDYIYTEGIKKYVDTSRTYAKDSAASRMITPVEPAKQ
ncbi:MAG TPA: FAD:protein FMN transferase [Phycisphaerales bacterium]|nr:FAD:protein FMN transferase [Phycisphaerales bacterium]